MNILAIDQSTVATGFAIFVGKYLKKSDCF